MRPRVFKEFENICSARKAGGSILEIGAEPNDDSLLNLRCLRNAKEKVGISLEGPFKYKDFSIIKGNANEMSCFGDNRFDTVLCHGMLEHDKFFWKTIAEIKRVIKPGGLVVIGTPGYTRTWLEKLNRFFRKSRLIDRHLDFLTSSTVTYEIHNAPGDYYRFSPQTFKEIFFEGMRDVKIHSIMLPPRIIGSGIAL